MSTHIVPVNDLIDHAIPGEYSALPGTGGWVAVVGGPGPRCLCDPRTEPMGAAGWLIVHHSLDDRERTEPHPFLRDTA